MEKLYEEGLIKNIAKTIPKPQSNDLFTSLHIAIVLKLVSSSLYSIILIKIKF